MTNRNILIEQLYPGIEDYTAHFYEVLPALKDSRYLTVDGNPLFMIYKPLEEPEVKVFIETWRKLAIENGLKGIYFVGHCIDSKFKVYDVLSAGFDAANSTQLFNYTLNHRTIGQKFYNRFNRIFRGVPLAYPYKTASKYFIAPEEDKMENVFPSIIPGWDHTAHSGREGLVLTNSTPVYFGKQVEDVVDLVQNKEPEHKIISEIMERVGRRKLYGTGFTLGQEVTRSAEKLLLNNL